MADHFPKLASPLDRTSYDRLDLLRALQFNLLKIAQHHAQAEDILAQLKERYGLDLGELTPKRPFLELGIRVAAARHPKAERPQPSPAGGPEN